jgi:hypothetical protein
MQQILDRLEAVSKIVLIVGSLIGGIWAAIEYVERKHDARVAETLGYVRRFSSDPLLAAQERIGVAWYAVRDRIRTLEDTPVTSTEEFARRKRQLVMTVVEKAVVPTSATSTQLGLVPDLDMLIGFFAELQVCIQAKLCEAQTARDYFQAYARTLYCLHEPFIRWKSTSYSQGYGNGLREFVRLGAAGCPNE